MNIATVVSADGARLTISVPLRIRKRGGRKVVIAPDGQSCSSPRPQVDSALVKAIARAYRWQRLLEQGVYASISDLAAAEHISATYVSRLLRLTLMAPEIVEAVLNASLPGPMRAQDLLQPLSPLWVAQRETLLRQIARPAGMIDSGEHAETEKNPPRHLEAALDPSQIACRRGFGSTTQVSQVTLRRCL